MRRAFPLLAALAGLAGPAAADAVTPAAGEVAGTTSQRHLGQRGTVHAIVREGGRSLQTLVVDARLRCDGGTVDARTFTATDVNITARGTFHARGTFGQPVTSADGQPVTARFTTRLQGRFTGARRMTGTLHARADFQLSTGEVYATCRSGRIRFDGRLVRPGAASPAVASGSAARAAADPSG